MIELGGTLSAIDAGLRWDGWRAVAALGTFAAVWIALRRDGKTDRRLLIKEGHLIGAVIADAIFIKGIIEDYQNSINDPSKYNDLMDQYDDLGGLPPIIVRINSISIRDCPTVEVMTTCSVIRLLLERAHTAYELLRLKISGESSISLPSLELQRESIDQCINDLKRELIVVSGRYYEWSHQAGHRRKVEEKISGSPRVKSIKQLPHIFRSIITNKQPGNKS